MLETKKIGNKIADARKKVNISQAELAQHLFISPQAVGKWERGESMPDITTLNRLAEILGVDLNYFSDSFQSVSAELTSVGSVVKKSIDLPSPKQKDNLKWNMSSGNWVDADFSGLKNLHEKFSSSNIQRCKFIGSDLSELLLKSNHVVSCDFSGSDISSSLIRSSHLSNNIYKDCSLQEAEFAESHLECCDFSGANFTRAVFKTCTLQKNIMTGVVLNHTSFVSSDITDVIFDGTLEDCSFENCTLKGVTFQNSMLVNTFFKNTNLKRISFVDCQADRITCEFLKAGKADLSGITILLS
jgi:uncharacterized protein YjbI with pentapeptide repeats